MKAAKIALIIQAVCMYVSQIPLYVVLIVMNVSMDQTLQGDIVKAMLVTALVLLAVVFPTCLLTAVFSIISIFKGNVNPTKTVMVIKLALIPWYVVNFIISFIIIAGMLNPWLFIAAPLMAALMILTTYAYMLATSLPDITHFIRALLRREHGVTGAYAVSIIFLFVYCLDIVGGILYFKQTEKQPVILSEEQGAR